MLKIHAELRYYAYRHKNKEKSDKIRNILYWAQTKNSTFAKSSDNSRIVMKLKISNLGPINSMEIDMSKPFILFAGDNSTGKTYAATFLYTLIIELRQYLKDSFSNRPLPLKGSLFADDLYDLFNNFLKEKESSILSSMNLNVESNQFKCEIVTSKEEWQKELKNKKVSDSISSITKETNSFDYQLRNWHDEGQMPNMESKLITSLFFDGIFGAKMFTAERSGIYTFGKLFSQLRNSNEQPYISYSKPIADELTDFADIKYQSKKHSGGVCRKFAKDIEDMIFHGKLIVSKKGDVSCRFADDSVLGINESSSAIKTLAPLVFYLRYSADPFNVLFVDEPELNLHPQNQIYLARIFVKMINDGLRVVISTHSDYIVREINNTIMANTIMTGGSNSYINNDNETFMDYKNYSWCLSHDKFALYLFKKINGKVEVDSLPVNSDGIIIPSFDEAFSEQKKVKSAFNKLLYY